MDKQQQSGTHLKNADFLAWRVSNYQKTQRENAIKNIFYTRERDRLITHH